jgi:hypothetical protein
MSETQAATKPPLDEVMLAMDVVDTLRHRELVVERALSADTQDRELMARLKEIYAGQGIAVSDAVLERGVKDLRENRFVYTPPAPSVGRRFARVYVSRGLWGKPLLTVAGLVAIVLFGYQLFVRGPELAAIAALPAQLEQTYSATVELAEEAAVDAQAETLRGGGELAFERADYAGARAAIAELDRLHAALLVQYEIRVQSRPDELAGVWRIPDANENAQNYYLIVEAVDSNGNRLTLPIQNEEDGATYRVSRWGLRVDEATFQAVASDKQDDGIIQNTVVGQKRSGRIGPEYRPGVLNGAITDW